MVTGSVSGQRDRRGVEKSTSHSVVSQRVCSMPPTHRQTGHTLYLLYAECADGGPVDLQDAVPRVDGIAVVGTDMHPVDPRARRDLRRGEGILKTSLTDFTCAGRSHLAPKAQAAHRERALTQWPEPETWAPSSPLEFPPCPQPSPSRSTLPSLHRHSYQHLSPGSCNSLLTGLCISRLAPLPPNIHALDPSKMLT